MQENKILLLDEPYNKINYSRSDQPMQAPAPVGLWYVINEHWLTWALEKGHKINFIYSMITEDSHIIKIDDLNTFQKFTTKFCYNENEKEINWQNVYTYYDGIEVNFKFGKRETWLSDKAWEHPCGCIWNKDAINKLQKITVDNEEI